MGDRFEKSVRGAAVAGWCIRRAGPATKVEIDSLLAVAPRYGIEIRSPQH